MAGKYTKQGVFPLILDGSHSTAGSETWGSDTEKVGLIKITGAHTFTFDGSYPGEPGDTVVVANNTAAGVFVDITPDPLSDADSDNFAITAGNYLTIMYHHDHGWIPVGATNVVQA